MTTIMHFLTRLRTPFVFCALLLFVGGSYAQDETRALYENKELFEQLSGAAQNLLHKRFGPRPGEKVESGQTFSGDDRQTTTRTGGNHALSALVNTLVNNPAADATAQDTQSETAIVLGAGSNIIAGFNDSGSYIGGASKFTGYSTSTDGGTSWTDGGTLPTNTYGDAGDPVLARDNTLGITYFAALNFTGAGNNMPVFRSTDDGATWLGPVVGTPGKTGFQDKEWIAVDNFVDVLSTPGSGDPTGQGNVYLVARDFGAGNGIYFFRSTDNGLTFGPSGGTHIVSGNQGAWVDVGTDHSVYVYWWSSSPRSIQVRKSTDQGVTFGAAVTVAPLTSTGVNGSLGLPAGFRSNSFPAAAVNRVNGNLYVTFNDPTAASGGDRGNIKFTQSTDGGATWSTPVIINDDGTTRAQYMPAIAVKPDGSGLAITWYDNRNDPADRNIERWGVTATISGSTVTFGSNFRISPQFPPSYGGDPVVNSVYMGDYDMMAADNTYFHTLWGDNRDQSIAVPARNNANVRHAKFTMDGPGAIPSFVSASVTAGGGNGNGVIDLNECNDILVTLGNDGNQTATGVSATLATTTPGVTVSQAVSPYPGIAPRGTETNSTLFKITTSPSFVCGTQIALTLTINYSGGSDVAEFGLPTGTAGVPMPFENTTQTPIVDNATTEIPIAVAGFTGVIEKVTFSFHATHTWDEDLDIYLVAPDGTVVELSTDNGGSGDNYGTSCSARTIFDDDAPTSITAGTPPFAGTFRPEGSLASLNGKSGAQVNGTWILRIRDDTAQDAGIFYCGTISIAPATCVDAAGAGCDITSTPTVNSPIAAGATSVSGTGPLSLIAHRDDSGGLTGATSIDVFVNSVSVGTTTVDGGGTWTKSGLTALVAGDSVKAKATASGKNQSEFSNVVVVQGVTTAPVVNSPITAGATSVSGTGPESMVATGGGKDAAGATIIDVFVNSVSVGTTTVAGGGTWTKTGLAPLVAGDTVKAKATADGKLQSAFSNIVIVEGRPFITTWKTDNAGASASNQIRILGTGTNYSIVWEKVGDPSVNGSATGTNTTTVTFPAAGTYRVSISGNFTRIMFTEDIFSFNDRLKLLTIEQWGDIAWSSMANAFYGCSNLTSSATDAPDLSAVSSLAGMFRNCIAFNSAIGNWNTANVTNMNGVFMGASAFNQPIGNWNTANVTTMANMFHQAHAFNQPIGNWNTANVGAMVSMFSGASAFNQPIGNWNTANVSFLRAMFQGASAFNQPIGNWTLKSDVDLTLMLNNSGMDCLNYSSTLIGWSGNAATPSGRALGATGRQYGTNAQAARDSLVNTKGWTITGDTPSGIVCQPFRPFITTWKTDNTGTSASNQITIPGAGTNYSIVWEKVDNLSVNGSTTGTNTTTVTFPAAGTYRVSISGDFTRIVFDGGGDRLKLLTIEQWGDIAWSSMANAFHSCFNLTSSATDAPDLSAVSSLTSMFRSCTAFNSAIDNWNTANVTDMSNMFRGAGTFNQPIGNWNTANVTNMNDMFVGTSAFNQPIGNWNTANVTNMNEMFVGASAFNQAIGTWNTANVTSMGAMFVGASAFNQPIGNWNTANVTSMGVMFRGASAFNQPIGNWNTANVTSMHRMFDGASAFNQPIGNWTLKSNVDLTLMLNNSGMDCLNYSSTLIGWSSNPATPSGRALGATGRQYGTNAQAARDNLVNTKGWTISGDAPSGILCAPPPTNVVVNPDFESGPLPWVFYTNGTGSYVLSPAGAGGSGNAAKITVNTTGSNMQFYQSDLTLRPGVLYRLTFKAYSSDGRDLSVFLHRHDSPFTNYGLNGQVFNLTTSWQTFTVEFTSMNFPPPTPSNARLRFRLNGYAANGTMYFIDDVSLEEVNTTPVVATKVLVETAPGGSGVVVPAQNIQTGNAITVYAISRDPSNTFVANVTATWSLENITGGVVAGNLVPAGDGKSATFTGGVPGTANIKAVSGGLTPTSSETITVVPPPPPPTANLLTNGGFESGTTAWSFFTNGTATFSSVSPGNVGARAGRISVTNQGTNVQLYQSGISLTSGSMYRLRFKAFCNTAHDVSASIHKHGAPYTPYGMMDFEFDLTNGWQDFSTVFTAGGFSGTVNDARLRLWLAPYDAFGDVYWFDEVILEPFTPPIAGDVAVGPVEPEIPEAFVLAQNYPNPFNPVTKLRFGLPHDADVHLVVYDVLGREVAELVNGQMTAGYHETAFDGSGLSSGIYFYKLTAGTFVDLKKMILTK